ncbi:YdcF family protein [Gordonia oryzae]|uniref:YdcF family protein n=1 Tax=Gordonia oryzae TaxID=2487349 RepID=A0A3N4GXQ0_9ACTN|nr:YdcF family protein [Gordonia oryzae]
MSTSTQRGLGSIASVQSGHRLRRRYLVAAGVGGAVQESRAGAARRADVADGQRARSSTDTVENATYTVAMLKAMGATGALIVTNAFHMPRAIGDFRGPWPNNTPLDNSSRATPDRLSPTGRSHPSIGRCRHRRRTVRSNSPAATSSVNQERASAHTPTAPGKALPQRRWALSALWRALSAGWRALSAGWRALSAGWRALSAGWRAGGPDGLSAAVRDSSRRAESGWCPHRSG